MEPSKEVETSSVLRRSCVAVKPRVGASIHEHQRVPETTSRLPSTPESQQPPSADHVPT
ncbi:hypothetical protein Zm00014a_010555 [Zea mays]|uniref:Uncharacterized protein n=1 Tax=Zea mays TaxID=4577 RepID=A0A317YI02_MAIZE|nr:hypothetical protein Zm00014a_010555 [Zea mays]